MHDAPHLPGRHLVTAYPVGGVRFEHEGSLAQRALRILQGEALSTCEVAARILGITGESGAAARAVFALLGCDPRFAVSAEGVWSLAVPAEVARHLREEEWVVVDVETTGGSPQHGHRVTEIAAVCVAGGEIRGTFSSLVNPERRIPGMITALTGITQEMVSGAPRFCDVAYELSEAIGGRVFVAHNASFDWRFVCAEMERATGTTPSGRQLCTVKLARKLLPQLPSRSLDGLALFFGLEIESRHRALDDAVATAHVLLRFFEMLEERGVEDWSGLEIILGKRAPRRRRRTAMPRSMDAA